VANEELEAYKKYAGQYPDDSSSAIYLYKAADLAHGVKRNREAIDLYRQFITKYPNHTKTASAIFLEAFIYDSELRNKDSAKILYKEFLEKYPNHTLASSVKASLDQIETGMSDEDLVKMFEARADSMARK